MGAILTLAQQVNKGIRGTPRLEYAPQVWVCFLRSPALAGEALLGANFSLDGLFKRAGGAAPRILAAQKFNPLSCCVGPALC